MNEEYIKMCKGAKELQDLWEAKPGDAFYVPERYEKGYGKLEAHIDHLSEGVALFKTKGDIERLKNEYQKLNYIWLPRQEDLQKMITNESKEVSDWYKLSMFTNWSYTYQLVYNIPWLLEKSFEIIWLCYVMDKNYDKVWNPEKEEWEPLEPSS